VSSRVYRHRAINFFLRTYQELWLADENVGQEVMIEDLTVTRSFFESTIHPQFVELFLFVTPRRTAILRGCGAKEEGRRGGGRQARSALTARHHLQ
jgi:hypothetical protein